MKRVYDDHYRIYCRYTHGALLASTGDLDEATDRTDNWTMGACALIALDNLISLGAKSSNRDRLAQRLPTLRVISGRDSGEKSCFKPHLESPNPVCRRSAMLFLLAVRLLKSGAESNVVDGVRSPACRQSHPAAPNVNRHLLRLSQQQRGQ